MIIHLFSNENTKHYSFKNVIFIHQERVWNVAWTKQAIWGWNLHVPLWEGVRNLSLIEMTFYRQSSSWFYFYNFFDIAKKGKIWIRGRCPTTSNQLLDLFFFFYWQIIWFQPYLNHFVKFLNKFQRCIIPLCSKCVHALTKTVTLYICIGSMVQKEL